MYCTYVAYSEHSTTLVSLFYFVCGCISSRFSSRTVGEHKAGIVWLFVRGFAFGMHKRNIFTGLKRPLPPDCYWRFAMSLFLNARVALCTDESTFCIYTKNIQTCTKKILQMTDGDDQSVWSKACFGPLTEMSWCLHYTPFTKPAFPLPLCFSTTIYTHVPDSRHFFFVTNNSWDI